MEFSYSNRFRSARIVPRALCAALAVLVGSGAAGWTLADEHVVEQPRENTAEAPLSFATPLLAPPPGDALSTDLLRFSAPVHSSTDIRMVFSDGLRMPEASEDLPPGSVATEMVYPIDLPSALQLAGANNLQIALARERVNAATARSAAANALWIPSISAGAVYNNHAGRIQGTEGEILEVSRNSLFVGGGAGFGHSPLNGGASGPARMFVDLSLADTIFEPLAARQLVRATAADRTATFNDMLLQVAATYLALARAQTSVKITEQSVANADGLARITGEFAKSGHGLQADADRAIVEAASRKRDALQAQEELAVVSATLARLLRLDPAVRLQAVDETPVPLEFVDRSLPLETLIRQATSSRPEMTSADAQRDAAYFRSRQEQMRPWVPHLYAGASGGGFGGGEGSDVTNFGDRADFDVAAIWQFENLGYGNAARQREQQSLYRQANLAIQQVRETIAAEVTQSYQQVQFRRRQIDVTSPQVASAQQAVRLNLEGIRGGVLRPIEIQQAIGALAAARTQHLDAVIDYNVAQMQMLRAIGQPPEVLKHINE
jgi:outer membrane protein TolC